MPTVPTAPTAPTARAARKAPAVLAVLAVLAGASIANGARAVPAVPGVAAVPATPGAPAATEVQDAPALRIDPSVESVPAVLVARGAPYVDIAPNADFPAAESRLESIRANGDLVAQRAHVWALLRGLTRGSPNGATAAVGATVANAAIAPFLTWFGAGEVFDPNNPQRDPPGPRLLTQAFSLPPGPASSAGDSSAPPRIVRGHYNLSAYRHIRAERLYLRDSLLRFTTTIPAFSRDSAVLKTVWWPVPADGVVALPVWDPEKNPPRATGNDYPNWARVVGLAANPSHASADVELMGKNWRSAKTVALNSFYHLELDEALAAQVVTDSEARKLSVMLLGRPLRAGDSLALVALHVATREITNWVWGTFWWHDAPNVGPFAAGRPDDIQGPWRHYLMNVSLDGDLPREADGQPHVAYNPWLEARFGDSGQGSGMVSNCTACHARATIVLDAPFRVTRREGPAPVQSSVKTSFLWTVPLQAR